MRSIVIAVVTALALIAACGPASHRQVDEWGETKTMQPEITGDNAKDEARWRRELASDPWGDDARLLTDDDPFDETGYLGDEPSMPPKDFVGPPAPPSRWDNMQSGGTKFGKVFFSVMTVLVTLGMMAAPYLLMI
jgi:hypothetical protein